jgi:hypothetical protein
MLSLNPEPRTLNPALRPPPDIQLLDTPPIDAEVVSPSGAPCAACATPVEPLDRYCPACGTPNPAYRQAIAPRDKGVDPSVIIDAQLAEPSPLSKHFQCKTCGAEVATDPSQLSYVCPFCDSTYVVEVAAASGRQPPEFVIGFSIPPHEAQEKFPGLAARK